MTRPDVVERIVAVALDAMTEVVRDDEASNDEIMSAYFTMLRRGIHAALALTRDNAATRKAVRESLFTVLADVADPTLH